MFDKLIEFVLQSIRVFQVYHFIHAYERGVVLRFGKFHRMIDPGTAWVLPLFLEKVLTVDVMPEPMLLGPQSLTTADNKQVVVSALVVMTVLDPRKFLLELQGGNVAVNYIAHGAVARLIESRRLDELRCSDAEEKGDKTASHELAKILRRKVKDFGVGVQDAQITEMCETFSLRLMGVHQ